LGWYLVEQEAPKASFRFPKSVEQLSDMHGMGAPKLLLNPVLGGCGPWPVDGFAEMCISCVTGKKTPLKGSGLVVLTASRSTLQ
jgi:hypothetical protein